MNWSFFLMTKSELTRVIGWSQIIACTAIVVTTTVTSITAPQLLLEVEKDLTVPEGTHSGKESNFIPANFVSLLLYNLIGLLFGVLLVIGEVKTKLLLLRAWTIYADIAYVLHVVYTTWNYQPDLAFHFHIILVSLFYGLCVYSVEGRIREMDLEESENEEDDKAALVDKV